MTDLPTIISAASVFFLMGVLFFVREKYNMVNDHEGRLKTIETKFAVQDETNKHRDERSERIENKLDRLLEKFGVYDSK